MPKATYVTSGGGTVQIDAKPEELVEIMKALTAAPAPNRESLKKGASRRTETSRLPKSKKSGPTRCILELKDEDFFKSKRKLSEIQGKLEEMGHIYAQTSLSPVLIRLTKSRQLRRLKEKGGWVYVNS